MNFSHCDTNENFLTLHDCVAERASFENGKLIFSFGDGFWISPNHPDSPMFKAVRTDYSEVAYILEDGADYDVTVYVFEKNIIGQTARAEWTVQALVEHINSGEYKLEFLSQYLDEHGRIVVCELLCDKKPHRRECIMKISASEVRYDWNNLREDRVW